MRAQNKNKNNRNHKNHPKQQHQSSNYGTSTTFHRWNHHPTFFYITVLVLCLSFTNISQLKRTTTTTKTDNHASSEVRSGEVVLSNNNNNNHTNEIVTIRTTTTTTSTSVFDDYSKEDTRYLAFPRWDTTTNNTTNSRSGIDIESIIYFINSTMYNDSISTFQPASERIQYYEIVYILDQRGLHVRNCTTIDKYAYGRVKRMQHTMKQAFDLLQTFHNNNMNNHTTRWKRLREIVFDNNNDDSNSSIRGRSSSSSSSSSSLPFILYYGDYVGCGYQNLKSYYTPTLKEHISLPIFTVAADIDCMHSFPVPTYKTIKDSQENSTEWEIIMNRYKQKYPIQTKIRKVVWRGGLTGPLKNYTSTRWRLPYYVTQASKKNQTIANMFDVGLNHVPPVHRLKKKNDKNKINQSVLSRLKLVGGIKKMISPMEEFQKYYGIIDIDGNSWSSRFGTLLCYNSIILKVDAQYIEYFYNNPIHDPLIPYQHYIPIHYNLSNLIQQTEYILNPMNDNKIHSQSNPVMPNTIPKKYHQLFHEQTAIGWDQVLKGRLTTSWVSLQEQWIQYQGHSSSGATWASSAIKAIWDSHHSIWNNRCKQHHGECPETQRSRRHRELSARIHILYSHFELLDSYDQALLNRPIKELLKDPIPTLERWVVTNERAILDGVKRAKHRIKNSNSSIRSFYNVIRDPKVNNGTKKINRNQPKKNPTPPTQAINGKGSRSTYTKSITAFFTPVISSTPKVHLCDDESQTLISYPSSFLPP